MSVRVDLRDAHIVSGVAICPFCKGSMAPNVLDRIPDYFTCFVCFVEHKLVSPMKRRQVPSVKLTISVPVELWDEARNLAPELAASHIVQVALATWIETRKDQT